MASEITIKDVAARAGVSVATVSRVLNNGSSIRTSTKESVEAAIRELRYIPNATARNLKTNTTRLVGFLVSNISNNHFTTMARIVEQELYKKGYSLIVCSTGDSPELERIYLNRFSELHLDGIILNTTSENNALIAEMSHTIPIVLVDRNIRSSSFIGDFVGSNNFAGMQALTKHLISNGHREIAIVTSNLHTSTGRERLAGFSDTVKSIGVTVDEQYPYRYDCQFFNQEDGFAACKHLMSLPKRPTAIVVANNAMAIGVYQYLCSQNISVPDEVSVVSYGNIKNYELFCVKPTFTTLNPDFIGEKAAKLILSRIDNPLRTNHDVIFEPQLIVNNSVRKI